jgi:hypothetical protein
MFDFSTGIAGPQSKIPPVWINQGCSLGGRPQQVQGRGLVFHTGMFPCRGNSQIALTVFVVEIVFVRTGPCPGAQGGIP